ncbi:hypothetical protein [Nonomuraea typhae]|uniref:HTH luxR-type domain-containing protein n=1 Tax=Nonomuraea typhae TaxID=2603600 RepID=A0ABW7Z3I1_9ACTN
MSLGQLGITEGDARVYRSLLADPSAPVEDAAAVARLAELGLVTERDGGLVVTDPETALSELVKRRISDTFSEMRHLASAWQDLARLQAAARAEQVETVERVDDPARVCQRVDSLALHAREALSIHPVRRPPKPDEQLPRALARLQDGVRWRTVIGLESLRDPMVLAYCTTLHRAGDLHRSNPAPLQRMVILDREVAFVPTEPDRAGAGAFIIRQPGVVATLVHLFEQTWAASADLEPPAGPLSAVERQVLHLLLATDKDEVAARELGVSLRSYRRRVAEVLERLQVANRFQAGAKAKELGWI